MATTINPGDFIEVKCPSGATPVASVGQKFPADTQGFVVIKLDGGSVTLGPVKGGPFAFEIPCSDGAVAHVETVLTPLAKEKMPKPENPLSFFVFAFPLWLWIAIALILMALVAIAYGIYRWVKRRYFRTAASGDDDDGPKVDPIPEFKTFLTAYRKLETNPALPPPEVERFFSDGGAKLRAYLEARLGFKASWATTTEFLGQLKAATMSYAGLKDLQFQVESFLSQADLVRFSKTIPAAEGRGLAYSQLSNIHLMVERTTTTSMTGGEKPT